MRPVVCRVLGWGLAVFIACVSADDRPGELRSIGVSLSDLGNPFFVRIARGVENAARRLAGKPVRVTVVSSAYDLQRQMDGAVQLKTSEFAAAIVENMPVGVAA